MSNVQNLLLESLLGTKHVDCAAIIKLHKRTVLVSSPGFNLTPNDIRVLVNGFSKNPLQVRREGFYFKEKYYTCVRADERSLYAKKNNTGLVVVQTHLYLLVATYREDMYASVCVEAVEKLGDYLRKKGN
ncbi:profilin-4 [Macrotis lagotis]|uniref:profilin-4 n=1 Tax=Macrotis lagotis TaxID=92651 RepID=UPI003D69C02D